MAHGICSVCGKYDRLRNGWCPKHYERWRRHGDPEGESSPTTLSDYYARLELKIDRSSGISACHPWQGSIGSNGYGNFWIQGSCRKSHIVAWEIINGPVPTSIQIDHECHNIAVREGSCKAGVCLHRRCCNESHLIARTPQEHSEATPAWKRPTGKQAVRTSILTEDNVLDIKSCLSNGEHYEAIAAKYKVHPVTIHNIKTGTTWGWLE
jgi:hypothetical protein